MTQHTLKNLFFLRGVLTPHTPHFSVHSSLHLCLTTPHWNLHFTHYSSQFRVHISISPQLTTPHHNSISFHHTYSQLTTAPLHHCHCNENTAKRTFPLLSRVTPEDEFSWWAYSEWKKEGGGAPLYLPLSTPGYIIPEHTACNIYLWSSGVLVVAWRNNHKGWLLLGNM